MTIRVVRLGIFFGLGMQYVQAITDLTFFSVSDTHYGQNSAEKDAGRAAIPGLLNTLPGVSYPSSVGGGPVATPRGVTIPGDLTDYPDLGLWADYTADYSPTGKGKMKFPVYDGLGNHDYTPTSLIIKNLFIERNALRKTPVQTDANNYHYSWDWDQVHFVQLNLYGGASGAKGNGDAFKAYEFLLADLEKNVGKSGRPVFVMEHFPMEAADTWWLPADKEKMANLLKSYNCIGILHGHSHAKKFYTYLGLDVYDDGSVMNSDILVFHITDGRMVVLNRVGNAWGTLKQEKVITMGTPVAGASRPKNSSTSQGEFKFSIAEMGRIYAVNESAFQVQIISPSGKILRNLKVTGSEMLWDRKDQNGKLAPLGIYLVHITTKTNRVNLKVLLP
jgi:hypothetical protein